MASSDKEARKALKKWEAMLANPTEQRAFTQDPAGYMAAERPTGHAIDVTALPQQLVDFLQSLSGDDPGVALLGRMQSDLDASRLLERQNAGQPDRFATVSKF